ncbi:hypothetical protein KUV64_11810 [Mameliella alba]|uniref:HK97 gp10 family phage protein n=1 Tax=Mameliella alba TaxID=561184 RepID=UPI001C94F78A|nr:HK97 gp10 family phage protein [Mameliella alba]MBY6119815.1 hypothetical protein [Mameliella alba]
MTVYKFSEIDRWTSKVKRRLDKVQELAVREVFEVAQKGVPVDQGDLKDSLAVTGPGGSAKGSKAHLKASTILRPGGVVRGTWGKDAPYVLPAHYGEGRREGAFWIDRAAVQWPRIVANATLKAKAMLP